jgi:RHS repeat-associated protein
MQATPLLYTYDDGSTSVQIAWGGVAGAEDRLGSVGKFFPYGDPRPNNTGTQFATYTRDSTGLDYAVNRYYSSLMGRFTTADPDAPNGSSKAGMGSMKPRTPSSFNRYVYALDDPINKRDPSGLFSIDEDGDLVGDYDGEVIECLSECSQGGVLIWNAETETWEPATFSATASTPVAVPTTTTTVWSVSGTTGAAVGALGGVIGAAVGGYICGEPCAAVGGDLGQSIGSMVGLGVNVSYVPSTGTVDVGPVASFTPGVDGGTGVSGNVVVVPPGVDPTAVASGWSTTLTGQPAEVGGFAVVWSDGQSPVGGYSAGTKTPISIARGYNFCVWNCNP